MILDMIVQRTRANLSDEKRRIDLLQLRSAAEFAPKPKSFLGAMQAPGLSVIGEIKQASPSKGLIREELNIPEILKAYNQVMSAVSVLTEPLFFLGSRANFEEARNCTTLPLLRKDFFIDPMQVYQAKMWGASCILLIAKILDTGQLGEFQSLAQELGMDALIEVHDEEDLKKAMAVKPQLIGINNRDLRNFSIDLNTTVRLRKLIPSECTVITESGIRKAEDLKALSGMGISGALVGEMFMRSRNVVADVKELKDGFVTQA